MDGRRGRRTGHVGPFRADGAGEVPCAGGGREWVREELVARCPRVMEEGRAEGSVLGGRGDEREGCGGVWVLVGTPYFVLLCITCCPAAPGPGPGSAAARSGSDCVYVSESASRAPPPH